MAMPRIRYKVFGLQIILPICCHGGKKNKNSYSSSMAWMEAAVYLQDKWKIWDAYEFLNPEELTPKQKQAIACEAIHEPDCTSRSDFCLPSISECPDAFSILSELKTPTSDAVGGSNDD
mmetsp:Transcript_13860/g.25957  ORF Transcript_13860/g.25957 Transcript_13860/m.25957 type:complete len:119 (-) Transcript_13860:84-440(-)